MRIWVAFLCAVLVGIVPWAPASAAPSPDVPCPPAGASRFTTFSTVPPPIQREMLGRFAPGLPSATLEAKADSLMAPRDATWQVTDVVTPGTRLPGRRFIEGFQTRDRVWVWYESGGLAHMFHVAVFESGRDQSWRVLRHVAEGTLKTLCSRLASPASGAYDEFW